MNIQRKTKGFTIIEVVLVLAIAGLIFLMVFIALPALQRSQKDTQRKNDLSKVITSINNYTANNRGALPTIAEYNSTFKQRYVLTSAGDSFIDPAGANSSAVTETSYQFINATATPVPATFASDGSQNRIYFQVGTICGATENSVVSAGSRKVSFRMVLEGGGVACVNN